MAKDKTKKPVKEPTAAQKTARKAWCRMYEEKNVDFFMREMAVYGAQLDRWVANMSVVFIFILVYLLPDVKTDLQIALWFAGFLCFPVALITIMVSARYSSDACLARLKYMCEDKKMFQFPDKIAEAKEESEKALAVCRFISRVAIISLCVGFLFFLCFVASILSPDGIMADVFGAKGL